jgi:hypothetical protein
MDIGAILTGCGLLILAATYVVRPLFQGPALEDEIEAAVQALRQTPPADPDRTPGRTPRA